MKLNSIVLVDLFSKPPTREEFRFIFITDNELLEDKILKAGFLAVGIASEEQKKAFLDVIEEQQFTYLKDYYFISSSSFGVLGEVKKKIEELGFTALPDGWKIFKDNESRFIVNEDALKDALNAYIQKVRHSRKNTRQSQKPSIDVVSMNEVEEKPVQWLVMDYIPEGQITILAGDGGSGKTSAWISIVSSLSKGEPCFLIKDMIPEEFAEELPKKVLFFSAEDTLEHVIKPRLRQNDARMENLLSISITDERFDSVRFNSPFLEQLIAEHRPSLVVFDPIQAFIPPEMEMSKRNAMRNCLRPLIGYGEKYGCTFLIIVHTNKQSGLWGRKRIADSADIWDIARSVLMAGETKSRGIGYISHEKCNYGITGKTVLFSNSGGKVKFEGYTDQKDKDFILEGGYNARYAPQRKEAEELILDFLKNGGDKVSDLNEMAKAEGISERTLSRAKEELKKEKKISIHSVGYGKSKVFYIKSLL